jgi:hypothetical protein
VLSCNRRPHPENLGPTRPKPLHLAPTRPYTESASHLLSMYRAHHISPWM